MTDSADKRWSMKADRCADSRREALAPVGRMHYCGQTQLSGPNGLSALCHATTLTSARAWAHPPPLYFIYCIPALKHSQADLLHQFILENISADRCWNYHISAISWHIDNMGRNAAVKGGKHSWQVGHRRLDLDLVFRITVSCSYRGSFTLLTLLD